MRLDGTLWMVDASILHGEPLRLDSAAETGVAHGAWGVRARPENGRWLVRWRPLHKPDGLESRLPQDLPLPAPPGSRAARGDR